MAESNYLMVASLNFGTTDSCYAFSTRNEFMEDPIQIHTNPLWRADFRQFTSITTPTNLLLDKDKEFVAFGYDAENQYAEVILDDEKDDFYFFQRFTTLLHSNKNVTGDMIIKDVTGKTLPAFDVFKLAIEYLVDHLKDMLKRHGNDVGHDEVKWVLTVPSSWTGTAKEIMKLSAEWAGIQPDHLVLVPKSTSAFVYCQTLLLQDNKQKIQDGAECMVVDLGGVAADITVFKSKHDQIIENYQITDDDCGNTLVNKQFFELFDKILGKTVMKRIRENDPFSYLHLERVFEISKKNVQSTKKGKINMTVPVVSLDKVCRELYNKDFQLLVQMSKYANIITLLGDIMRIDADTFRNMFKATIDNVISLMEKIFIEYKDSNRVTHIFMVGGFSNCSLVHDAVKQKFSSRHIIIMEDASMVAAKGAVLCGHQPRQYINSQSHEMIGAQTTITQCIFCDNPGMYYCNECKSAFCQQCRKNHDKLPATKSHTVTDLKKVDHSAFSSNQICLSHKSELIYFCTKCHVLICGKCVTTEHKGHDISDVKTVADSCRRRSEKIISDLKEAVTKIEKVVEQMTGTEESRIKSNYDSSMTEINEASNKILNAVSMKTENKRDEVEDKVKIEKEEFRYKLANKERVLKQQKATYENLLRLKNVSNDITFITSYETLKRDVLDISDCVDEGPHEQLYKLDKKMFVQEVVNAIASDFEMRLVGMEDGTVVVIHKTETQKKKEKGKKLK